MQQIIEQIHTRLDEALSLEELAQLVHMSPRHFSRLFKEKTGLSPHQYILQARVRRAEYLLLHTDLSIAEIAHIVGFHSQSHLNRHFKRALGITPKQLRVKAKDGTFKKSGREEKMDWLSVLWIFWLRKLAIQEKQPSQAKPATHSTPATQPGSLQAELPKPLIWRDRSIVASILGEISLAVALLEIIGHRFIPSDTERDEILPVAFLNALPAPIAAIARDALALNGISVRLRHPNGPAMLNSAPNSAEVNSPEAIESSPDVRDADTLLVILSPDETTFTQLEPGITAARPPQDLTRELPFLELVVPSPELVPIAAVIANRFGPPTPNPRQPAILTEGIALSVELSRTISRSPQTLSLATVSGLARNLSLAQLFRNDPQLGAAAANLQAIAGLTHIRNEAIGARPDLLTGDTGLEPFAALADEPSAPAEFLGALSQQLPDAIERFVPDLVSSTQDTIARIFTARALALPALDLPDLDPQSIVSGIVSTVGDRAIEQAIADGPSPLSAVSAAALATEQPGGMADSLQSRVSDP